MLSSVLTWGCRCGRVSALALLFLRKAAVSQALAWDPAPESMFINVIDQKRPYKSFECNVPDFMSAEKSCNGCLHSVYAQRVGERQPGVRTFLRGWVGEFPRAASAAAAPLTLLQVSTLPKILNSERPFETSQVSWQSPRGAEGSAGLNRPRQASATRRSTREPTL